jgi:HTH-type transcriptional regulator / antitoxin HipB
MSGNQDISRGVGRPHSGGEVRVRTVRDLSRALRDARTRQGLSQEETSLATGINRTYLSGLESGHETAILKRLLHLIDSLGLELVVRPRDFRRGAKP